MILLEPFADSLALDVCRKKLSELFDVMGSMLHAHSISYLAYGEKDNLTSPGAQVTLKLIALHPGWAKVDIFFGLYQICIVQ